MGLGLQHGMPSPWPGGLNRWSRPISEPKPNACQIAERWAHWPVTVLFSVLGFSPHQTPQLLCASCVSATQRVTHRQPTWAAAAKARSKRGATTVAPPRVDVRRLIDATVIDRSGPLLPFRCWTFQPRVTIIFLPSHFRWSYLPLLVLLFPRY